MKTLKPLSKYFVLISAIAVLFSSCASTTMISSSPSGAEVYLDDEYVGVTPYPMTDSKIVGACTYVRLEKPGYEPLHTDICRNEVPDVEAIIGGVFFPILFLWTMQYETAHHYRLSSVEGAQYHPIPQNTETSKTKTKAQKLRELKDLYNDGVLTKEAYEKAKKKILEQEDRP